jgi:hypothetical protein
MPSMMRQVVMSTTKDVFPTALHHPEDVVLDDTPWLEGQGSPRRLVG